MRAPDRAGQERGFPSFCSSIGDILSLMLLFYYDKIPWPRQLAEECTGNLWFERIRVQVAKLVSKQHEQLKVYISNHKGRQALTQNHTFWKFEAFLQQHTSSIKISPPYSLQTTYWASSVHMLKTYWDISSKPPVFNSGHSCHQTTFLPGSKHLDCPAWILCSILTPNLAFVVPSVVLKCWLFPWCGSASAQQLKSQGSRTFTG